jgi:small-conductance mechanosensitive channel
VELFGVRLLGLTTETGHKLLLTALLLLVLAAIRLVAGALLGRMRGRGRIERVRFWARQFVNLFLAVATVIGLISIWFDDPSNLTTAMGLITAGLAFALQKVVTSLAGYFVILRGKTFTVGDRITMGGVRGDVIALGFFQTTIMEMGQPPPVQAADPAMWVQSRQFTGRIVTVANSRIFDEPIYNYTRDFPYIWEELRLPIAYRDDPVKVEPILLDAARKHAVDTNTLEGGALDRLAREYGIQKVDFVPAVYFRLTDNWIELTVRFLVSDHGVRKVKDAMAREILARLRAAGIGVASTTIELSGTPTIRLLQDADDAGASSDAR